MTTRTTAEFHLPDLASYQREHIFDEDHRFVIIEASTKTGKTAGSMLWLLSKLWVGPPGAYWWVEPIIAQSKIVYRRYLAMLRHPKSGIPPDVWSKNDTELSITFFGDKTIFCKGAENPDGLFAEDVQACVIDEMSRVKDASWHAIRTTLTSTEAPARLIGNVKGRKNWSYALARRAQAGTLPGWKYATITAWDAVKARLLSRAEVEAAKRELPDDVFGELYEARATEDGANPFGMRYIDACIIPELSDEETMVYGVDLASVRDWTVVTGLDRYGKTTEFYRWQGPWRATKLRVRELCGDVPTLVDQTGVGRPVLEDLQAADLEFGYGPGFNFSGFIYSAQSKQPLMENLAIEIKSRRVGYLDGLVPNELRSMEYLHTRTGVRYEVPAGMTDDCIHSLALAARHLKTMVGTELGVEVLDVSKPYNASEDNEPPETTAQRILREFLEGRDADGE